MCDPAHNSCRPLPHSPPYGKGSVPCCGSGAGRHWTVSHPPPRGCTPVARPIGHWGGVWPLSLAACMLGTTCRLPHMRMPPPLGPWVRCVWMAVRTPVPTLERRARSTAGAGCVHHHHDLVWYCTDGGRLPCPPTLPSKQAARPFAAGTCTFVYPARLFEPTQVVNVESTPTGWETCRIGCCVARASGVAWRTAPRERRAHACEARAP